MLLIVLNGIEILLEWLFITIGKRLLIVLNGIEILIYLHVCGISFLLIVLNGIEITYSYHKAYSNKTF